MTEEGGDEPTIVEEQRASGGMGWKVYAQYYGATNSYFIVFLFVLLLFLTQIISSVNDWWASRW